MRGWWEQTWEENVNEPRNRDCERQEMRAAMDRNNKAGRTRERSREGVGKGEQT